MRSVHDSAPFNTHGKIALLDAARLLGALILGGGGNEGFAVEPPIAVIVGKSMAPAAPLSQTVVLGIFARKKQLWDDHGRIVPVNLPATNLVRRNFSLWLFKRLPEDLQSYWNDEYFHGVLPPPVLSSEEAVLRFVSSTKGAIGYVSICSVDSRVEILALIAGPSGPGPCPH